jgi:hypothetical protein
MNYSEPDRVKSDGEFQRWEHEMWSILTPLKAALNSAFWVSTPGAALATSDQLRAIARDSTKWQLNHHCHIPDLAVSFRRVLRSSVALADLLLEQSQNPNGVDWPALNREVIGFHRLLEQFLVMMTDHSTRIPSDPGQ